MRFALITFLAAAPATAQELVFSDSPTQSCLQEAVGVAEVHGCVGRSADACMRDTPGGETTVGMAACLDREFTFWDDRLNAVYRDVRAQARQAGGGQAEALLAMQRAWITYRDARCDFARSQWSGGTGAGPASVMCLMHATAEQVFVLEGSLW